MDNCIFCKIARHEIPKKFLYEDDDLMVFEDINPAKEVHILTVPKDHFVDFMDVSDDKLMTKLLNRIKQVVADQGLSDKGFRVFLNGGGAQAIDHLHIHLIGPIDKAYRV